MPIPKQPMLFPKQKRKLQPPQPTHRRSTNRSIKRHNHNSMLRLHKRKLQMRNMWRQSTKTNRPILQKMLESTIQMAKTKQTTITKISHFFSKTYNHIRLALSVPRSCGTPPQTTTKQIKILIENGIIIVAINLMASYFFQFFKPDYSGFFFFATVIAWILYYIYAIYFSDDSQQEQQDNQPHQSQ